VFKEPDGKVSFTRVSSFLLVLAYIVWASFIVFQKGKIPDIPAQVVWLIGVAYSVNKLSRQVKIEVKKSA